LTRSPVIYRDDPVFEDARLEPFADQAGDALVADPVFDEANQPFLPSPGDVHPWPSVLFDVKYSR